MTWTIKLHDSVSSATLWHHTRGSHDKEKKNSKGFPSCSGLPVTLNLGANCQLSPQFLRARLYGSVPAMSEDFAPKAYFGNTWKQHHPALSCCVGKATSPQHGTETGVSWVRFVLGTCRILSGKMKFNVTFSLPLRQVGSALLIHMPTLGLGLVAL